VKFGIAVNRRYRNKDNEWVDEDPSFFNCQCWNQLAENVSATLTKGMRIICKGRMKQRSWENDKGEKITVFDVELDAVGPELKFATASVDKVERDKTQTSVSRASVAAAKAEPEADPYADPF
jgi:single-strand DNA-binding protein